MKEKDLKILVIGSGGREHTIAKICANSPLAQEVIVAPGNGGISKEFTTFPINAENNQEILDLVIREKIDFVVVGPEVPLCNGVIDALEEAGINAYGPCKSAALLEGSKAYTIYQLHPMETFSKLSQLLNICLHANSQWL